VKKDIKLTYLKKATKFLTKNTHILLEAQVDELLINFIKKKYYNIDINIDFKQMKGKYSDVYRIRKGDVRIIVRLIDDEIIIEAIITDIGFRGDIYK